MNVGKMIQQLREESHLLQADLAKKLGLGRTTISNYENNYSFPDLETLISIADFFNVSTDYLLGLSNVRSKASTTSKDEAKILHYYNRLDSENQDYIRGEMVKLYREQQTEKEKREHLG